MKFKRFTALSMAAAMALSAGVMANAAELTVEQPVSVLSEYANRNVTCTVTDVKPGGAVTQKDIQVSIPADATKAEASALINSAALRSELNSEGVSPMSLAPRKGSSYTTLYTSSNVYIQKVNSGYGNPVAQVKLPNTYQFFYVSFTNVPSSIGKLNVSVADTRNSIKGTVYQTVSLETSKDDTIPHANVVFYHNIPMNGNTAYFYSGDTIIVRASGTSGAGYVDVEVGASNPISG